MTFQSELQQLINKHSIENESNTPDFILARLIREMLLAYNNAVIERDNWWRPRLNGDGSAPVEPPALPPSNDIAAAVHPDMVIHYVYEGCSICAALRAVGNEMPDGYRQRRMVRAE